MSALTTDAARWPVFVVLLLAPAAHAVDAIVLEVRELTVAGMPVTGASARLDLLSDSADPRDPQCARSDAARSRGKVLQSRAGVRTTGDRRAALRLRCRAAHGARRPDWPHRHAGCAPNCAPIPASPLSAASGLKMAGTTASFDGRLDERGWQVRGPPAAAKLSALRKFAAPWFAAAGRYHRRRQGDGRRRRRGCRLRDWWPTSALKLEGVDLTNEASTIVTDKLAAHGATARANRKDADTATRTRGRGRTRPDARAPRAAAISARIRSHLEVRGKLSQETCSRSTRCASRRPSCIDMTGRGRVNLAGETPSL